MFNLDTKLIAEKYFLLKEEGKFGKLQQVVDKPDVLYFASLECEWERILSDEGSYDELIINDSATIPLNEDELAFYMFGNLAVIDHGKIGEIGPPYNDETGDNDMLKAHDIYDEVAQQLRHKPYLEKWEVYTKKKYEDVYYAIVGKDKREVDRRIGLIMERINRDPKKDPTKDELFRK